MRLSEKLIKQFRHELYDLEKTKFKEIYQVKTIVDGIGGSIFFSCRFKTPDYRTYLLSLFIQLSGDSAHIRTSVHEFCERKWYSRMVAYKKETIEKEKRLGEIIKDMRVRQYYMDNKHFPYSCLAHAFVDNGFKEFIVSCVNQLEELK